MKRILLSMVIFIAYVSVNAQEGYKISGKIEGVPDGWLLLINNEKGRQDTLNSTRVVGGAFEFTGVVDAPMAAYIVTTDGKNVIHLILENAVFTINARESGTLVEGGRQQEIYSQFSKINAGILTFQEKIQQELRLAEQKGDRVKMQELVTRFNKELENAQAKEEELLARFADTYVAAHVVASGMEQMEPGMLKTRFTMLGAAAKASVPGQSIAMFIREQEKISEGNMAPDFTLPTSDVGTLSLHGVKARVKLFHFWASWSIPSREENVNLLKIYQQYHPKGFDIISVSLDQDKLAWFKAIGEDGMDWENISDLKGETSDIARLYFVRTLPYTILLDSDNIIVAKNLRGDALRKKIAQMLKKK